MSSYMQQVDDLFPELTSTSIEKKKDTALLGYEKDGWSKSTILTVSLVFFVIANYFYQAGLIFYDSTLATISTPGNKGRIGGIGIGVGYVGALVGILSALYITDTLGFPYPAVFQLTAALFLIFLKNRKKI